MSNLSFDEAVTLLLEAPEDEPWGDVAWGDVRTDDVTPEPNTKDEQNALRDLMHHFDDSKKLPADRAEQFQQLSGDKRYSDVLAFDESGIATVYRGMGINLGTLAHLLKIPVANIEVGKSYEVEFLAKPRGEAVASWTPSKRSANRFAQTHSYKGAGVILHAQVSDNPSVFIINPDKIYQVKPLKDFKPEQEVIGVGPVVVDKIEVVALEE